MDGLIYLLALIVIVGFVGLMLYIASMSFIYKLEAASIRAGGGNAWKRFYRPRRLPQSQVALLQQKFTYYKRLPAYYQLRFETRLVHMLSKLDFEARSGLIITDEMRLLLAACLVKLTFGYRQYHIAGFHKIILYPDVYYSAQTQSHNKGETHVSGVVVLSWKDTLAGLAVEDDNLHLALHEFAHALYLAHARQFGVDQRFILHWPLWLAYVQQVDNLDKIRNAGFLRDYAFSNQAELFACMVEAFFESPAKFNQLHPTLFQIMSLLLNQQRKRK